MTAPVEPDLDLSHLLLEAPVPADGASRAARTARRRHLVRRVAAGGAALAVVVGAVAAAAALRSSPGDRTVRTADSGITATLLSTADVQRVLPEMVARTFSNGRDISSATGDELRVSTPPPRRGFTRQWTWNGESGRSGPAPDRVEFVINNILEFGNDRAAIGFLTESTVRATQSGDRVVPMDAIAGATEFVGSTFGNGGASTSAVLFPRGRFVYAVTASYGGNHTDELHRLAIRQAQLARPATTNCPISAPLTGVGDGLPQEGQTTLDHVRQTMNRYEPIIRQDFAGVLSLSVEPRNGEVWRGKRGDFTVHRVEDYWIVVHVETATSCPGAPAAFHSYDGVPLHFVVG